MILLAQGRHADRRHPGSDSPLLLLTTPPSLTSQTTSVPFSTVDRDQGHVAVIDQQPVPRTSRPGPVPCRSWTPGRGSPSMSSTVIRTRSPVAHMICGPSANRAEPDLRALQVGQGRDVTAGRIGGAAGHGMEPGGMVGVRLAMAEVQPGHVHPRFDQGAHTLRRVGSRAEGADDFCATGHIRQP